MRNSAWQRTEKHLPQFKAGGSLGAHSVHPWLPSEKDPAPCPACLSRFGSMLSWVQFPTTVESSLGLPGAHLAHQCPGTQLQEARYQFSMFCFLSLIINIISITGVISKVVLQLNL